MDTTRIYTIVPVEQAITNGNVLLAGKSVTITEGHIKLEPINPPLHLAQQEKYVFTFEELYAYTTRCMQAKADMEEREGRTEISFTPQYQIHEFLKQEGVEPNNQ